MTSSPDRLIVFVKAPLEGTVKTRLAAEIGDAAALQAYRTLVGTLLDQLAPLHDVELRFTPDTARALIEPWRRRHWRAHPQGDGALGERLQRAFAHSFTAGARGVAIIGSDCPEVTEADIHAAWSALEVHEVVLGPARDGGYWLIALRHRCDTLFEDIPWSTPGVLGATLDRTRAAGLSTHLLRELTDVDTAADWAAFQAHTARLRMPLGRTPA